MMSYVEHLEPDLPPIGFGQILANPIGLIIYLLCLWVFVGWVIYVVEGYKGFYRYR
jgi:hypothetical protein